ncbi:multiubiquitin domain-containing protein [Nonomuraea fuscirosea]|uniref:multiubiquitin domain-containing protein n=1 Tax=Nonomuraea fuscirosea TaxID=1291556 RepID=UPI00340BF4C9
MTDNAVAGISEDEALRQKVEIVVNRQEVVLTSRVVTGLEIKQAAIAQGVKIDLAFRLSKRVGNRWDPVDDDERIRVHMGEQFRAQTPDENS